MAPARSRPAIRSDVAIGRRMKGRDGLIGPAAPTRSRRPAPEESRSPAPRPPCPRPTRRASASRPASRRVERHLRARLELVDAVDHDDLSGGDPLPDHRVVALRELHGDVAHLDRGIGLDDVHEDVLRAALKRGRRDDHDPVEGVDEEARVHELVRIQAAGLVLEEGLDLDGAGVAWSIWLSTARSVPSASLFFSSRSQASTGTFVPFAMRESTDGNWSAGIVKTTVIGCSCVITTRPFASARGRCFPDRRAAGRRCRRSAP